MKPAPATFGRPSAPRTTAAGATSRNLETAPRAQLAWSSIVRRLVGFFCFICTAWFGTAHAACQHKSLSVRGMVRGAGVFRCPGWHLDGCGGAASCVHGMGIRDELVPFNWQRQSIQRAANRYGIASVESEQAGFHQARNKDGIELTSFMHRGGHSWPAEQTRMIVEFFQRSPAREAHP